jgi:hypothetical protein
MTPAVLLAGVVVVIVLVFLGTVVLGLQDPAPRRVNVTISLVPPKLVIQIEHRAD